MVLQPPTFCYFLQVVEQEADELVAKYGTPRRTAIVADGRCSSGGLCMGCKACCCSCSRVAHRREPVLLAGQRLA